MGQSKLPKTNRKTRSDLCLEIGFRRLSRQVHTYTFTRNDNKKKNMQKYFSAENRNS